MMYKLSEKVLTTSKYQRLPSRFIDRSNFLRNSCRTYETEAPRQKKGGLGKVLVYGLAGTAIVAGSALAYAKYNLNFRKQLNDVIPGTSVVLQFISPDEKSESEKSKTAVYSNAEKFSSPKVDKTETAQNSYKSTTVPPPLLKVNKPSTEMSQIRNKSPQAAQKSPIVTKKNEGNKSDVAKLEVQTADYQKYNMSALEKEAVNAVKEAMVTYNNASRILKEYENEVAELIDKSVKNDDHNIWFRIREKTDQKERLIETTENRGMEAMEKIEHLKLLINDPKTELEVDAKESIENNIKNALNDLIYTKALFTQERSASSVTEKYSQKVEESRKLLSKELGVLFPSLLVDSESVVTESDLELFVLYTTTLLSFYQKELKKLETLGRLQVEKIVEHAKAGNPEVLNDMVGIESEKIRREMGQELLKKEISLRNEFEKELKDQLRRQHEIHIDHLEELAALKDKEMEIKLKQNVEEKVDKMKINYNRQLARIIGRMKGLDNSLKEKAIAEKQAKHSQQLWSACQALIMSIKAGNNHKSWEEQLKPLQNEISAISKAAAEDDPFVAAIIASIPEDAVKRGVFSELALKDRFIKVEKLAYRLANVKEGRVTLPKIFASYLQSFLLIKPANPIPPEELADQPIEISKLNNYDILCRARYWIDRGDYEQCLKYMNLLKGSAKAIASEWMKEVRIFLETQQAANVLLSHAVYSSLVFVSNSS